VDRVDRRDAQRVGDDGPGGAAPAGGLDPLVAGETDEVGDDEEVARIAHPGDDAELVVQPLLQLGGVGPVAADEAALALRAQPALDGLAVRHREVRDPQLAQRELEVDHLGDPPRVPVSLTLVGEEGEHLGRRLQVELGRLEPQAVRRVEVAAGADAEEDVVSLVLRLVDVVEVVRDDQRQAGLRRQAEELRVQGGLLGKPVVLQLQEEVVLPEDVAVLARQVPGELDVVALERLRDLAAEAGRHPDEPRGVAGQVLAVDPRLVVVAVEVRVRHEPAQVAVAGQVLREQHEVEGLGVGLPLLVAHRAAGDVGLHADDRLDPLRLRGLVEGDGPIEGAVVGQGERVEAQPLGLVDEVADPAQAVEKGELGVDVEMREVVRREGRHGTSMVAGATGNGREVPARHRQTGQGSRSADCFASRTRRTASSTRVAKLESVSTRALTAATIARVAVTLLATMRSPPARRKSTAR
jgi:hypothetical protein